MSRSMSFALLARPLDLLGQLGQALGVEGVVRVEEVAVCLVKGRERDGLELEAVLQEVLGHSGLDLLHERDALLVQLKHGHLGGDAA